jgi:hypothetical protein
MAAPVVRNNAVELVGAGAVSDPLIAVESNRAAIINRLVAHHADALAANGVSADAFRDALSSLRADQLLAASLVSTVEEVTAIVTQNAPNGTSLQRFVAMTPMVATSMGELPPAEAYLVRDGDALSVVKATEVQLGSMQFVGYFAPATASVVMSASQRDVVAKDGSGSGAQSWIGYTAGSNIATATGSAVAAGRFNAATNTNASVFAGQSNSANGVSSLVIGGFDNHATAIDTLVGAGAGNRATAPRAVVMGGGYNLASGPWSFVGGGGRQAGTGNAGTSAQDNVAGAQWTVVAGGVGNRATDDGAAVVGGGFNVASGMGSFIGGGSICCETGQTTAYPNHASGRGSAITGGYENTTSGPATFVGGGYLNTASGSYASAVLGGYSNTASGQYASVLGGDLNLASGDVSVALGESAATQSAGGTVHHHTFVYSDGSSGTFRSRNSKEFDVLATGGMRFATGATVSGGGDAVPDRYVDILPASGTGIMSFEGSNNVKIVLDDTDSQKNIGVQPNVVYYRTNGTTAWYLNGTGSGTELDPGTGGQVLATLTNIATTTTVTGTFRAQAFTATSDRNQKTGFETLNAKAILAKVAQLPVMLWSYKNESGRGIRHIGPVAQDFSRLFNVGYDDKSITTVDADGVALAAIQGLKQELDDKNAKIERLERELDAIKAKLGLQ